jgi:hypothetical protein
MNISVFILSMNIYNGMNKHNKWRSYKEYLNNIRHIWKEYINI